MADFASTKQNSSFELWFEQLQIFAELNGDVAGEKADWVQAYEAGMAVDSAYYEAFGDSDD
ncbi:hypothetical protein [Klebsiella sp. GW_Kp182]|uniref:hypothetical protein n=1 Tax=Klebsiella sp. GW_Kp182 TaxID=3153493 RepID=UPI0032B46FA2